MATGGQFSQWAPYSNFVQTGMVDGVYVNAAFTMLAAGPPRLALVGGNSALQGALEAGTGANEIVFPLGIIQSFSHSYSKQFNRLFEIGSERSYFIAGRSVGQLSIGRVYYHGASLLRVLYAYYQDALSPDLFPAMYTNKAISNIANPHNIIIPPGYENLYFNLASDLFGQPIGLMYYVRDIAERTLGAVYYEACYIPNHSLAMDANGTLLQEQVQMQFERMMPVHIANFGLVDSLALGADGVNMLAAAL